MSEFLPGRRSISLSAFDFSSLFPFLSHVMWLSAPFFSSACRFLRGTVRHLHHRAILTRNSKKLRNTILLPMNPMGRRLRRRRGVKKTQNTILLPMNPMGRRRRRVKKTRNIILLPMSLTGSWRVRRKHIKENKPILHHRNQNREGDGSQRIRRKILSKEERWGDWGLLLHHRVITTIGYPLHIWVVISKGHQHSIPVGIFRPHYMVETHHSSLVGVSWVIHLQGGSQIIILPVIISIIKDMHLHPQGMVRPTTMTSFKGTMVVGSVNRSGQRRSSSKSVMLDGLCWGSQVSLVSIGV